MAFEQLLRLEREAGFAPTCDNDNYESDEWSPSTRRGIRGAPVAMPGDGPDPRHLRYIVERRMLSDASCEPRQAANDNWPLAKVLRRDGLTDELATATRYRRVYDAATAEAEIKGVETDGLYIVHRMDLDGSTGTLRDKGVRRSRGASHPKLELLPIHALRTSPDQPRASAKSVREWNGDAELIDAIDARRELSQLRAELGWLADAWESAVVDGERLEDIGRRYGIGQAAGGAGRALVNLGLLAVTAYWSRNCL